MVAHVLVARPEPEIAKSIRAGCVILQICIAESAEGMKPTAFNPERVQNRVRTSAQDVALSERLPCAGSEDESVLAVADENEQQLRNFGVEVNGPVHSERQAQEIKDYVEWRAHGEKKVLHVEKVASERIFGREHDVWDVHTDKERWWLVTGPTNLYSQSLMPSLDYTLSFHVGLMARVAARREPEGSEAEQEFLLVTNRKMVQASEAFDKADEAEEFQAVGMRCRECLLALVRELTTGSDMAVGEDVPKAGDFPEWNVRIANAVAPGGSEEYVRGYLKTTAERAWRHVN
jgi:hypothetical protein